MMETFPLWARGLLEGGQPWMQAAVLGLLTFVQEDLPALVAALWSSTGRLHAGLAFLGIFLGIWLGDLLLYGVARLWGRPVLTSRWFSRWVDPAQVQKSEAWFHRKGAGVVLLSRFVPGTRLPTYLAAGLLQLPLASFLSITALAVFIWTGVLFALAHFWGESLLRTFQNSRAALVMAVIACILLLTFRRVVGKVLTSSPVWIRRIPCWLGRWSRWEFWPAWLFYAPVALWYVWLSIRHRGWTLPTSANPGISTGGMVGESKFETLQALQNTSPDFTVPTWLLPECNSPRDLQHRVEVLDGLLKEGQLDFPLILKPDVGQRGVGVRRIQNRDEALTYMKTTAAALLIQRYVSGPYEVGVFYYRYPGEKKGHVFAVTEKIFPRVWGDGVRTLEQLIWDDPRARFMAATYLRRFSTRLAEIPSPGQEIRLVEAGNHAQGCIFRDGRHLVGPALEQQLDAIALRLDGFFVGRFDIRYASDEALREGREFWILELNGAASEATSIYDERNSLFSAYRTLFQQWDLVFRMGKAQRSLGVKPMALANLLRHWRRTTRVVATYPGAD